MVLNLTTFPFLCVSLSFYIGMREKSKYPRWRFHREAHGHLYYVRSNLWVVEVHGWPNGTFSVFACDEKPKEFNDLSVALEYGESRVEEVLRRR
jgi:predicted membrane chloride channel (bestrophin family)